MWRERASPDDDDGGAGLVPETAGQRIVNTALVKAGIDPGRAYKLSRRASAAVVNEAYRRFLPHCTTIENSGAYLSTLIDDEIEREKAELERQHEEQAAAASADLADALDAIADPKRVPDDKLLPIAERMGFADFAGGIEALRVDPGVARHLAGAWLATKKGDPSPDGGRTRPAGGAP